MQVLKSRSCKRLSENVGSILSGWDANDVSELLLKDITDGIVFDADVFDIVMVGVVLN